MEERSRNDVPIHSSGSSGRITLDEREFIRQRLHGGSETAFRRYSNLVLARPGLLRLLHYEFAASFSPIPGALGLLIRKLLFRGLLAEAGKGAIFGRSITLRHPDNIFLGNGVMLDDFCLLDARGAGERGIRLGDRVIIHRSVCVQAKVGHISIGRDTSVGSFAQIISQGPIEIGENVSIAGGVMIAGGRYQVETDDDGPDAKKRFTRGTIRIGANVRLGIRSIILDGVTIGANAIVAPGSVVMNDVPEGMVVMGSPARPLRSRIAGRKEAVRDAPDDLDTGAGADAAPGASTKEEEQVRVAIRRYLSEVHFADFGPGELRDSDSLFEHDIIDSVGVVGLVTMIESEFGLRFDEEDLVPERLSSVDGLARLTLDRLHALKTGIPRPD